MEQVREILFWCLSVLVMQLMGTRDGALSVAAPKLHRDKSLFFSVQRGSYRSACLMQDTDTSVLHGYLSGELVTLCRN